MDFSLEMLLIWEILIRYSNVLRPNKDSLTFKFNFEKLTEYVKMLNILTDIMVCTYTYNVLSMSYICNNLLRCNPTDMPQKRRKILDHIRT